MPDYQYYKRALQGLPLPLAYVDLDLLDANSDDILAAAGEHPIRIASKSIRCSYLLRYLLDRSPRYIGIMSFALPESLFLAAQGFDQILLGYPSMNRAAIAAVVQANAAGKTIIPMVDCRQHLQAIQQAAQQQGTVQPICADVDMSSQFPLLYFGAHRSPLRDRDSFNRFLDEVEQCPNLQLVGIMGYEAQIAGVGDASPSSGVKNRIIRWLKRRSIVELSRRRQLACQLAVDRGHPLRLVNGGGTGSIDSTIGDRSVTELTVGSGVYSPGLFDHYRNFRLRPAATRWRCAQPEPGIWTLTGGGYIASGSIGLDKQPVPHLPLGMSLLANEGRARYRPRFATGVQNSYRSVTRCCSDTPRPENCANDSRRCI